MNIKFDNLKLIAVDDIIRIKSDCERENIETEQEGSYLIIKIKSYIATQLCYLDQLPQYFEPDFLLNDFAILSSKGEYCFRNTEGELTFNEITSRDFKVFCENLLSYYELYVFLKSEKFADHFNDANNEIVLYNSAKGIFKITYNVIPAITTEVSWILNIKSLIEIATKVELAPFFKNALVIIAGGKDSIDIQEIIIQSENILSITRRDFTLVSKQFDFEKFRDSLLKEKDKYFLGVREIINKIFTQAVGIPILISASVFSSYKVNDDTFLLILILFSFVAYIYFFVRVQLIYKRDLLELQESFRSDFLYIKEKSGLDEILIETERNKIQNKIGSSIAIITLVITIVCFLAVLVCLYIVSQISTNMFYLFIQALKDLLLLILYHLI